MIEAMAVNAEIEAMKTENRLRAYRGEAQAYPEEAFKAKADHLWALSNQAQNQLR